jgi:flagellar basal body-associated protein FliL
METSDNKNRPLIGQGAAITLGILATIVILAGMALIYVLIQGNGDGTPTPTPIPPTPTPIVFEWL